MAGVAFFYPDSSILGGAVQPTPTGFTWYMVVVFRDTVTNRKDVISGVSADTLDADTLVQVRDKLAAAAKAEGARRGYTVTTVLFFPLNVLSV